MQTQSGVCIAQRILKKSNLGNKLLALKYKILKGELHSQVGEGGGIKGGGGGGGGGLVRIHSGGSHAWEVSFTTLA